MIVLGLLAATAVALAAHAPWWLTGALGVPAVLWAPGWGWARWLERGRPGTGLTRALHAAWVGMALTWVDVAIARQAGIARGAWGLWALATAWALLGLWLGRRASPARPTPRRERLGAAAVLLAVLGVAIWRQADVRRPLDGAWYLEGAAEEGHPALDLQAGQGWGQVRDVGWPEAGARQLSPTSDTPTLVAPRGAHGRLVLAVRGPTGSHIAAPDRTGDIVQNTVSDFMTEDPDEGPVARYRGRGVAGIALDLELAPGATLPIQVTGDTVYLLPGTEAVWAFHATGVLRYVHYYQLLNQVENLTWAREVLTDRWFTWNQPPGWSPLLATAEQLSVADLPGDNVLFLWVLLLVGLSAVRLAGQVAPGAPWLAWWIPAGMAASHGLLMFEPGSTNFPDSLYAAALLGAAAAVASGRLGWFAALGVAAQALRWPGAVVVTMIGVGWWLATRQPVRRGLLLMWGIVALVGLATLAGVQLSTNPETRDLGFILYFETFPEHWHGHADPIALLARVPDFYLRWLRYTGGGLLIGLALLPRARGAAAWLLGVALGYSLLLATIDHHPSHYFLPLVSLTGAALVAGTASLQSRWLRVGVPALVLAGLWITLSAGQV